MPLSPEARTLLDLMVERGAPPFETQTPVEARATRAALAPPVLEPCARTVELDAAGVPVRLYRPVTGDDVTGLLVWFHGGGWVVGDLDSHDSMCHSLAARSGHSVLSVAYRLAPEHPFPAGLEDCLHALRWAAAHAPTLSADPSRLAVGGDSAGANLAAVASQLAPVPLVYAVLVYPAADARGGYQSQVENAEGYFLTTAGMEWFTGHYLSGELGSRDDPRVSPLLGSDDSVALSPPTMILTAGYDPLRDEGNAYAERLAEVGVVTNHVHFPDQIHGFFTLAHMLRDGRTALAAVAYALSEALAPTT